MAVASTVLHRGYFDGPGYSSAALCPPDTTFLIKSVSFYAQTGSTGTLSLGTTTAEGYVFYHYIASQLEPDAVAHQELWIALLPGDQVFVHSTTSGVLFWISGSALRGVSSWSPPAMSVTPGAERPTQLPR